MIFLRDFRVAAIDDAPFSRKQKRVQCACVVSRGAFVEAVFSFSVRRDGFDATQKIISCLRSSRFTQGTKLLLLNGVALAGLNLVDLSVVSLSLGIPVIAVTDNKPRPGAMLSACARTSGAEKRIALLEKAGPVRELALGGKKLYLQFSGCSFKQAQSFLLFFNGFPSPLRLAHLIAGALTAKDGA